MFRMLFGWPEQSSRAPSSSSSLRSPAPAPAAPRDSDAAVEFVDSRWAASLPIDPFIEILLHLEPTAIFCCAGVCKPWRRAIIGNASILGPHLDRFMGPSLLLGVFHYDRTEALLQRTPGPFQSVLPSPLDAAGGCGGGDDETPANSLVPAAECAALPALLSSRDGFILLTARSANSLCLCNPMTGYCTIVPAAAGKHCKYILLTAGGSSDSDPAVEILAVHRWEEASIMYVDDELTLAYQVFSTSGDRAWVWSPVVQCSGDHLQQPGHHRLCVRMDRRSTAVGRDAVYWLAGHGLEVTCLLGLDVRTGRTWTTELPKRCHLPILGMSGDGRLYLLRPSSYPGSHIKVWVLPGDSGQFVQQRSISIDMDNLLPSGVSRRQMTTDSSLPPYLSTFCPRSRCVVAQWADQELLIDIDDSSASSQRVRRIGKRKQYHCHCCPYEMDSSSTYISKMTQF